MLNRRCIARPTTIRLNIKIIMLLYMVTIRKKYVSLVSDTIPLVFGATVECA